MLNRLFDLFIYLFIIYAGKEKAYKPVSPAQYKRKSQKKRKSHYNCYITFTDDNCQIGS